MHSNIFAATLIPLLATVSLPPVKANDIIFDTKEDALEMAQELDCVGAYQWEDVWLPCEEDDEGADHSGHAHSH